MIARSIRRLPAGRLLRANVTTNIAARLFVGCVPQRALEATASAPNMQG
jgi:hypothetical protein